MLDVNEGRRTMRGMESPSGLSTPVLDLGEGLHGRLGLKVQLEVVL